MINKSYTHIFCLEVNIISVEEKIAEIIKDYRKGEVDVLFDKEHVHKWSLQFEAIDRAVILEETHHILKEWYFHEKDIRRILVKYLEFLEEKYGAEKLKNICFIDRQLAGRSQSILLGILDSIYHEKFNINLKTDMSENDTMYVYIDDALYTGSHVRKDIDNLIHKLNENSIFEMMFVVAYSNGLTYTKNKLEKLFESYNISLSMECWRRSANKKKIEVKGNTISYIMNQDTLWPSDATTTSDTVFEYADRLQSEKKLAYLFRRKRKNYISEVFSSEANRERLEQCFLEKGLEILRHVNSDTGIYPLGYDISCSFGFGSFCAFEHNISNTCPIVLWWGNNIKKNNSLDGWYPLLPRRTNKCGASEPEINTYESISVEEFYNTCPDCGGGIGYFNDGGNGFCSNCASEH